MVDHGTMVGYGSIVGHGSAVGHETMVGHGILWANNLTCHQEMDKTYNTQSPLALWSLQGLNQSLHSPSPKLKAASTSTPLGSSLGLTAALPTQTHLLEHAFTLQPQGWM